MKPFKIDLKPIGIVKTSFSNEEIKARWAKGVEAEIQVFEEYGEALEGIDGYSHLFVLFYMHEVSEEQRNTLKVRPRRFARYGLKLEDLPLVGVFSVSSPHRPNPIGLTIVRLLQRRDNILKVDGMDAFDGTPVLDLKPYSPDRCKHEIQLPAWTEVLVRSKSTGIVW